MNSIKKIGKRSICAVLEHQAALLRKKHDFTVVAVTGSVGKTSTKMAIAKLLGNERRVCFQEGNYNDRLTVPLVMFGHTNPGIFKFMSWMRIFAANYRQIFGAYPYDVVVLELGTDAPGQIAEFRYLKPELAVVTAVKPEHMEYFGTLQAVADEELTVTGYSQKTVANIDDIDDEFMQGTTGFVTYGFNKDAAYMLSQAASPGRSQRLTIKLPSGGSVKAEVSLLGRQGAKVAGAAFAAACELGFDPKKAAGYLSGLEAFAGRMRILPGIKGLTILDDSYNASPAAVTAALDVLYTFKAPQRIAILGSMNELGEMSRQAHIDMGNYCNSDYLDLVVTIGKDAGEYTAPAARKKGCKVMSFDSPYDAGDYVRDNIREHAVVLAKGSQNRVFAEESLKVLLADHADREKLVRQSRYWLDVKAAQFGKMTEEDTV